MAQPENRSARLIEAYCLGLLSEEQYNLVNAQVKKDDALRRQIEEFANNLEQTMLTTSIDPPPELKGTVLELLHNLDLEHAEDINRLPLINKYTDYTKWLTIVNPLLPEKEPDSIFVKQLRNEQGISQILMWATVDYPDEVHHDEEECFIVLKGRCRCHIENKVIELGPGGFLEVPLHRHHNVEVLEPVIAVVQRKKIA